MLPPIKRAKINADQLFKGRGTSSNPPMYNSKNRGDKEKVIYPSYKCKTAKAEVLILQTIKDNPGLSALEITNKTGFKKDKVNLILANYHEDGLICFEKESKSRYWYLSD